MSDIPKSYVTETCKMGQGDSCCRYLAVDADGFCCLKHTSLRSLLDQRARDGEMNAKADNCQGWDLTHSNPVEGG